MQIAIGKGLIPLFVSVNNAEDLALAEKIEKLIQTEEWKAFVGACYEADKSLLKATMQLNSTEQTAKLNQLRLAILAGFKECVELPEKILVAASIYRSANQKRMEEEYDTRTDEQLDAESGG